MKPTIDKLQPMDFAVNDMREQEWFERQKGGVKGYQHLLTPTAHKFKLNPVHLAAYMKVNNLLS